MMLPWMFGESWSSKESLKVWRFGGVAMEGFMYILCSSSNFISPLIFLFLVSSSFIPFLMLRLGSYISQTLFPCLFFVILLIFKEKIKKSICCLKV